MDIIVWIEYKNNYIPFIWLIFGYNRLSKPLILAWLIFGFKFSNIFMTIVVISISATHFLILRIKLSLDFADQFPAYTCCFKIPKNSQLVKFEGYLVDYGLRVQNMTQTLHKKLIESRKFRQITCPVVTLKFCPSMLSNSSVLSTA